MLGGQGALWFPTHVQITVIQSRGLRGKGKQGLNDAYTIIQLGKEKFATTVIEKTLCPRWQEECTFELPSDASDEKASVLRLVVMHRALLGMDSFLGQASLPLRELYQDTGRKKTQWYSLQSKPGEKSKERGEIEVSIQFLRNNMTASMFDLSHHEKPRSTLGKLKNKVKGKKSISDSVSAVVPSSAAMGSTDEDDVEKKKKKGFTLGFLGKSPMQKNQLSRSMLTLTTGKSGGGLPFFKGRAGSAGGESDSDSIGSSSTLSISENASGTPSKGNLSPSPSPQHRSLGRSSTEDLHKGKKLKVPFFSKLNEKKNKNKDEEEEEEVTMPPNEYRPSPSVNPFFKEEKVKLQDKPGLQAVKPIPVQPVEGSRKKLVPSVVLTDMLNSEGDSTGDDQGPWTHLTRAELQQLIVRSEVALKERDDRIQALENYIDHLLVRVMEETPSMLRKDRRTSRKAGRIC
uniref:RAB11 family interacting protein 1 (class I) a n=1 Tax=Eptatretus burgeri TaxID=7764 RepID=A0A8C4QGP1_EPTBU